MAEEKEYCSALTVMIRVSENLTVKLSIDNLNAFDSIYIDDIGGYSDTAVYILMLYKIMRYIYMLRKSCTVNTGGIDECNFAPS